MKKNILLGLLTVFVIGLLLTGCGTQTPASNHLSDTSPTPSPMSTELPDASSATDSLPEPTPSPSPESTPDETPLEITESDFAEKLTAISDDPFTYLNRTVHLQGLYLADPTDDPEVFIHYVYRLGPPEEEENMDETFWGIQFFPPEDFAGVSGDWIDVEGTLRMTARDGMSFPVLENPRVTIDNANRGAETLPANS